MPRLILRSAETGPVTHELTDETITIGRAPENMIVLDDSSVSGRHAQLERSGDVYRLKDLDSTNGTRVNNETITEVSLRIGDRLRFGKVEARFEADSSGSVQPLPEPVAIEAKPAETSVRPGDFANASPFPRRKDEKDPMRMAILAVVAIALLAFLGSMIAVLLMHAPIWG
jgi:pSer/pThr/pTyr-binding forkhead associated (FHA) protein